MTSISLPRSTWRQYTSIVVAWDTEGDLPHPRCLVGEEEIRELIDALEAEPDGDSWEIARRVNLRIRYAE